MGEYETVIIRNAEKRAARRKEAFKRLAWNLICLLVIGLALVGLRYIGFISQMFMGILGAIAVCGGCFMAGYIWRDVRW